MTQGHDRIRVTRHYTSKGSTANTEQQEYRKETGGGNNKKQSTRKVHQGRGSGRTAARCRSHAAPHTAGRVLQSFERPGRIRFYPTKFLVSSFSPRQPNIPPQPLMAKTSRLAFSSYFSTTSRATLAVDAGTKYSPNALPCLIALHTYTHTPKKKSRPTPTHRSALPAHVVSKKC